MMMTAMAGFVAAVASSWPDPSLSKLPPRLPLSSNLKPWATKVAAQTSTRRFNLDRSSKLRSPDLWEDPDRCGDSFDDDDDGDDEDGEGRTAETSASELVKKEVEDLLSPEERAIFQENKTPVLSKISTMTWSPFHTLTLAGQIPYMDQMIELGTDIDSVDKDGLTALHRAVIGKKEAVISHLLRKGANPHVKDKDGATPLHYAVQVGAMQTVKLLFKYGVDVNIADKDGWTPLHVAIQSRSRDIAKVLLVNGADKTRKNKDGKIPLDLSLCYGKDFKSYELAKLLKLVPANRDL